jgi:FlaA1/EpsC-like NDP-sugar epimerase
MSDDHSQTPVGPAAEQWHSLRRARVAVINGDYGLAEELLSLLADSGQPEIELRAKLQLALVSEGRGRHADAVDLLSEVSRLLATQRAFHRETEGLESDIGRGGGEELTPPVRAHYEAQLELARAWSRLRRHDEARNAYATLLREVKLNPPCGSTARHIAALANYRLAEILVEEASTEAYEHWRQALESGDAQVSPYAALRMATQIRGKLVTGRVERLFHHAMGSSDHKLYCEAALGLASHLKQRRQFKEARRYLIQVRDYDEDGSFSEKVATELAQVDQAEHTVPMLEQLTRSQSLRNRVQSIAARGRHTGKRVLIVGAGTGGDYLLESLDQRRYAICGFVDDYAPNAPGHPEHELVGRIDDLEAVIKRYAPEEVLLAIPTLPGSRRRAVVKACRVTSTPLRNLPRMHDLGIGWTLSENRRRLMAQLRPVEVEEIIGDQRVEIDTLATNWLQYETVLVVGAGALGAEICRRLADGAVGRLVVIDRRRSSLKKIETVLQDTREFSSFEAVAADAGDYQVVLQAFQEFTPSAVLNTIAHCSAPERGHQNPLETLRGGWAIVENEAKASAAIAAAAAAAAVPRTIHVLARHRHDPANPFDAMKSLSEEIVLWQAAYEPGTLQAAVRVGQLLDSRNGRLSRLKDQIATGAKVTIPGSDASVRFLSTARSAELVLHAARLAADGDLLELDCGDVVKIKDIAEQAIRLQNLYPENDVLIDESGKESWDDPPSPESRVALAPELGLFRLIRDAPLPPNESIALCESRLGDLQRPGDRSLRSALAEILSSDPELWQLSRAGGWARS